MDERPAEAGNVVRGSCRDPRDRANEGGITLWDLPENIDGLPLSVEPGQVHVVDPLSGVDSNARRAAEDVQNADVPALSGGRCIVNGRLLRCVHP
jgi:hypothetical protein